MSAVKIEMIHDFVCSWCAIGHKYLTDAINDLGIDIEMHYLPHELNPSMGREGMEIRKYFMVTHGWPDEKHDKYRAQLIKTSEEAGVNIDFSHRTHYFNTHLAHRLLAEAEAEGLGKTLHGRMLTAYHAHGINISDSAFLTDLAFRVGVSNEATNRALDPSETSVLYNQALRRRSGLFTTSVPAWVINGENLIIGSKSSEFFRDYLETLTVS